MTKSCLIDALITEGHYCNTTETVMSIIMLLRESLEKTKEYIRRASVVPKSGSTVIPPGIVSSPRKLFGEVQLPSVTEHDKSDIDKSSSQTSLISQTSSSLSSSRPNTQQASDRTDSICNTSTFVLSNDTTEESQNNNINDDKINIEAETIAPILIEQLPHISSIPPTKDEHVIINERHFPLHYDQIQQFMRGCGEIKRTTVSTAKKNKG